MTNKTVDEFLAKLPVALDDDKVFILACALELFRRTERASTQPQAALDALGEFAVLSSTVPLGKIPFSVTQTLLVSGKKMALDYGAAPDKVSGILLRAMSMFVDLLDANALDPAEPPEQILYALIAELSDTADAPAPTPKPAPEIYQSRMISRVFQPKTVTPELGRELSMTPVLYRVDLGDGKLGPDIRGLAFDNGSPQLNVILETGEYVTAPKNSFTMATTAAAEDYASILPALLAMATALARDLENMKAITPEQSRRISDGCLGAFTKDIHSVVADHRDVMPILSLIDSARQAAATGVRRGPTGPSGAMIRFPVKGADYVVVLDSQVAAIGPYVMSRLVTSAGDVVMRHETPRLTSPHGVYLFPLPDSLVVLRIL